MPEYSNTKEYFYILSGQSNPTAFMRAATKAAGGLRVWFRFDDRNHLVMQVPDDYNVDHIDRLAPSYQMQLGSS